MIYKRKSSNARELAVPSGSLALIGALAYYLHAHSGGRYGLVILAFLKALVWSSFAIPPHAIFEDVGIDALF